MAWLYLSVNKSKKCTTNRIEFTRRQKTVQIEIELIREIETDREREESLLPVIANQAE